MTHCYGYRRKTRQKFRKGFKQHGAIHISKTLTTYKVGDYVDIKVDGAIHKGMPYKDYHGTTGRVFNVNPRAIGVVVNKQVRNRIVQKKVHARVEHLSLSRCRENFLERVRNNDKVRAEAKKANKPTVSIKRKVAGPRDAVVIAAPKIQFINPKIHFELI